MAQQQPMMREPVALDAVLEAPQVGGEPAVAEPAREIATATAPQTLTPDICVIGGGAGGLAVAAAAAAFGVPVVLVEKNRLGGAWHNGGALAAQTLIAAADRVQAVRSGAEFGLKTVRPGVDFALLRAHLRAVTDAVAPLDAPERYAALGVRVIKGAARFVDRETVVVERADTAGAAVTIKARRFVIATGAAPALPDIPGLADTPYLTHETLFDLAECPRHLIVIGGDGVDLALAQAFRRLGAEVTVLDAAATPLAPEDPECAGIVLDALAGEGVRLLCGVRIVRVRRALARIQVDIVAPDGEKMIEGSHLLLAMGRRPNIGDLGLDAAGIRHRPDGIAVNRRLRTRNARVYAVGDVTKGPKSAQRAAYHAELVVRQALFRTRVDVARRAVPRLTYTDPELAQVGLSEAEARAEAGIIRVLRSPYRENDRAQAARATNGHIKIITDRNGRILGATVVGAQAAEAIVAWTLAVNAGMNIAALAGVIVPYPTYAEAGKRAAMTYFTRGLTSTMVRRIIGWLRRFG